MITCHICGNKEIAYYRQKIKSGRFYVTARCANGHSPVKGKPFYPVEKFNLDELPLLQKVEDEVEKQQNFFEPSPSRVVREIWREEVPVKKYPRTPIPPSTGVNKLIPIEKDTE